jgi:Fe2+ transport system protein FeoA
MTEAEEKHIRRAVNDLVKRLGSMGIATDDALAVIHAEAVALSIERHGHHAVIEGLARCNAAVKRQAKETPMDLLRLPAEGRA